MCCGFYNTEYTGINFWFSVNNKLDSLINEPVKVTILNVFTNEQFLIKNDTINKKLYVIPNSFFVQGDTFKVIIEYGLFSATATTPINIFENQCVIFMSTLIYYDKLADNFFYLFQGYNGVGYDIYSPTYKTSIFQRIKFKLLKKAKIKSSCFYLVTHDHPAYSIENCY